jgi:hypothetical protein
MKVSLHVTNNVIETCLLLYFLSIQVQAAGILGDENMLALCGLQYCEGLIVSN